MSIKPKVTMTKDQREALKEFAKQTGRCWKSELQICWMRGYYPTFAGEYSHLLQQVRNTLGPTGLTKLKL